MAGRVRRRAPYATDASALFVAYYASAEIGCHLALGWPVPGRVLDLFTEFRNHTNGLPTVSGSGLLGALAYHGLDAIGATEKDEMRALVLSGGPWSGSDRTAILDYCESDVESLARLLPAMLPTIDLPRALLRGRYMAAIAAMERNGVPIDIEMLDLLRRHWLDIQDQLIADIDTDYGVFDGRTFKMDRFDAWLVRTGIPWPRLESGRLDLDDKAFKAAARIYRRSLRCASCVAPCPRCGSTTWPSDEMAAIARCCRPSGPAPAAISPAIRSTSLAQAFGCEV